MQRTSEPGRHCGRPGVTTVRGCDIDSACADPNGASRHGRLARRDAWEHLGHGLLEVLPSVPSGQSTVSGSAIRIGTGTIDVTATHSGNTWTTTVTSRLTCSLHVGATLPAGSTVQSVTLNGTPTAYNVRDTNS